MTSSTYTPVDDLDRLQDSAELHAAQDERHIDAAVAHLQRAGESPPYRVFDIGCGYGTVTNARFGNDDRFEVIGVDKNREVLSVASEQYSAPNIEYVQLTIDTLPEVLDEKADILFSSYVMHHLEGQETALHNFWDLVNDPGALIIRSCDDGQYLQHPATEEMEFVVRTTDAIAGSSDRTHGRRLYTQMQGLSPTPANITFDLENYHTAGCSKEMRKKYWNVFHANRSHYAKVRAERDRTDDDQKSTASQEVFDYMERCMERARERIVENETVLDAKSVPMAVAYKQTEALSEDE